MKTTGHGSPLVVSAILIVGAVVSTHAEAPGVTDIVQRYAAAEADNARALRQYAYREHSVQQLLKKSGEKDGAPTSETWDVKPLGGRPFRRLVMRNDRPLSKKDEQAEEAREAAATARRQNGGASVSGGPPRQGFGMAVDLDPAVIAAMFEFQLVGEEVVSGRPAYVLEGRAVQGRQALRPDTEDYRHYRIKLWIDTEEFAAARTEMAVVEDGARLKKGSTIVTASARLEPLVWAPLTVSVTFDTTFIKIDRVRGTVNVGYSNYRRN